MKNFQLMLIMMDALIIILSNLMLETDTCTRMINDTTCRYQMTCEDTIDRISWQTFMDRQTVYYGTFVENPRQCSGESFVNINGNRLHSIDLVYTSTMEDESLISSTIPNFIDYNYETEYLLRLINSLHFKSNVFKVPPEFKAMENLREINLSNNVLVTAKLSNTNLLKSLTNIDFSHNNINQITVNRGEYIYGHLTWLNLSHNYLVRIPDAIFDEINNLQVLDISNNYIETLTPITFEGVKKLINLNLSHNRLTDINSSLFRFIELQALDLSYNRITTLNGVEFDKLKSISEIKLDHNSISVIDKNSFNNLTQLTTLILNNNKLLSLDKDTFLSNIALRTIDLSMNKFNTLSKNLFKNNFNLVNFSIKENFLEGALSRGTFEGLKNVKEIDLRNQNITSIEDFAFLGLDNVLSIFLNNNKISSLSKKSFNNLKQLNILDLSNNEISNINFEKEDLIQLLTLLLKNNNLTHINQEQFLGLNRLQFLDISNNNIIQLESKSFYSLENLLMFQISNNPLSEIILENTFEGLNSLPTLDISRSLISSIQNNTFQGMLGLKELNISHSKLRELQYNCFSNIDSVERIDLSYNFLISFEINTTELSNLRDLLLNNNLIKFITSNSFIGLHTVTEINLAHNDIENIDVNCFNNQKDLRSLDISYNNKFKFTGDFIKAKKHLQNLIVAGVNRDISFSNIGDISISRVDLSELSVSAINNLQLLELTHLNIIILKKNQISKLKIGDFANLTDLRDIDLSDNNISFIQPGTFKENTRLEHLNVSHNFLTTLAYGIFRDLIYLNTLDVSYNFITSLESERFFEVPSLNILIADHNLISNIDLDEFPTNSFTLSIGENPLPCEVLVKFNKQSRINITAIDLYNNEFENVNGVSCNIKKENPNFTSDQLDASFNMSILSEIKNILTKILNRDVIVQRSDVPFSTEVNLTTLANSIAKSLNDNMNITSEILMNQVNKNTFTQTKTGNETNIILNKILNVLSRTNSMIKITTTPVPIVKENATYNNILPYLNKINALEENLYQYKQTMEENISDLSAKISNLDSQLQSRAATTDVPKNEQLKNEKSPNNAESKSYFIEICVVMILVIMICFILFQVYKSKVFIRKRWSLSTNQLPDAMESSHL
ncbi:hypothetical protein K1T71_010094 [Dendrolimus kikuchii]|uniref:Uncharacterized protein n=1 Tax=Dendrolimus kikuchii TaxID=765133 RepID=A0ACC1CQQ3_9NEOP|nr:hypothetical protein K1T71_010094 [Dendrolimus kikuchii]